MNEKSEFIEPFKPSLIHKVYDWIDRLPGPYWMLSIIFLIVAGLLNTIVAWREHVLALGEINWNYALTAFFFCYFFVATDFLLRAAKSAVMEFLTILDIEETKSRLILFEFTHLPAGTSTLFFVLGAMIGLYLGMDLLPTASDMNQAFPALEVPMYSMSAGMAFVTLYLILRDSRLIGRLFEEKVKVDIFDQTPLYAISRYSSWLVIVIALATLFQLVLIPSFYEITGTSIIITLVYWLIALLVFWLPLRGVNRKLVLEKRKWLKEVNFRIKANYDLLHSRMDNDEYKIIADIREMIVALQMERENIKSISTWPWQTSTITGLLTAVGLPVLVSLLVSIFRKLLNF